MTAIFYPDCWALSTQRRYALEGRSPHNGTIPHRDGTPASEDEFGFKYREHQRAFRYRLLAGPFDAPPGGTTSTGGSGRVVWERWQGKREDSPHELVVADDGWAVLRTHGFAPEVIAVSPAGEDVARVAVVDEHVNPDRAGAAPGAGARLAWTAKHLSHSTAGLYWAGHSWPYFLRWADRPHFVWRTRWGDRLIIDLARAALVDEAGDGAADLRAAMDAEERRGVIGLLADLSPHVREVEGVLARPTTEEEEERREAWREPLRRVTSALQLVGVHRVGAGVPHLREWERIDQPSYSVGTTAMGRGWWVQVQHFRPILRHSLRLLGERPGDFPAFYFIPEDKVRLTTPPRSAVPDGRAAELTDALSGPQVLARMGTPDHVRRRSHAAGRGLYAWTEEWEYDSLVAGRWATLRVTWEEAGRVGRIARVEEVSPYWLEADQRVLELLSL